MLGKFCTDPVWLFYIYWLPAYLNKEHHFDLKQIGYAIPVIYIIAIIMANIAGWYAGRLISRGWSEYKARKFVMFICAMCLPFTALAGLTPPPWVLILLVAIAAGAHSGYSANIFTLASDCFPPAAVATVTGMAGFAGAIGGTVISSFAAGLIIKHFGYVPIFIMMGFMHPASLLFIHLLVRKEDK
jgi:ACS family hexuronate transporter-like MFS transporter